MTVYKNDAPFNKNTCWMGGVYGKTVSRPHKSSEDRVFSLK